MGEKEDGHGAEGKLSHDQLLTDPDEAVKFVNETQVDALAIAMGTSHGAYKFSRKPDGAVLAMNVIEEIHRRMPNMHLVMHGSSSVPQDLQDIINKFGGKMPQTWGVPVEEIQRGIKNGVRKINIDTDNRMAITGQIRKVTGRTSRRVRSAQISQARSRCHEQALQGAAGAVQYSRPGQQDQAAAAFSDGQALHNGRVANQSRRLRLDAWTIQKTRELRASGFVFSSMQINPQRVRNVFPPRRMPVSNRTLPPTLIQVVDPAACTKPGPCTAHGFGLCGLTIP